MFVIGDRVRVDIPDSTDVDFERYHGRLGKVVDVIEDDASTTTGDERDDTLYRVRLDGGTTVDLRWRDIRPP